MWHGLFATRKFKIDILNKIHSSKNHIILKLNFIEKYEIQTDSSWQVHFVINRTLQEIIWVLSLGLNSFFRQGSPDTCCFRKFLYKLQSLQYLDWKYVFEITISMFFIFFVSSFYFKMMMFLFLYTSLFSVLLFFSLRFFDFCLVFFF